MQFEDYWGEQIGLFLEDMIGTRTGQRGKTYARQGRVIFIDLVDGNTITAHVRGQASASYVTTLCVAEDAPGYFATLCTCPVARDCKHAVAVALSLVQEACDQGSIWARALWFRLGDSWQRPAPHKAPVLSPKLDELFTDAPAPARRPAKPKRAASCWWKDVVEAASREDRRQALLRGVRERVQRGRSFWYFDSCVYNLLQIENPIALLRALDEELEQTASSFGRTVAPPNADLARFLASEEAQALEGEAERQIAERRLLEWLASEQETRWADNAYVELVWMTQSSGEGLPVLCFELLLTTKRLRRSPRHRQAIINLDHDVQGGKRQLRPAQARLVNWVADRILPEQYLYGYGRAAGEYQTYIPVAQALLWLNRWAAQGLIEWENGGPVRFNAEPAFLTLLRVSDTEAVWGVQFPRTREEDARTTALSDCDLMTEALPDSGSYTTRTQEEPTVFVRRGDELYRLEIGGMPLDVLGAVCKAPEVPLERLRESPAGSALLRRLYQGRTPLDETGLAETVPVEAVLEWRYDEDESKLALVVRARAADGIEFYWTHFGEWVQATASERAPAEVSLERIESEERDFEEPLTPNAGGPSEGPSVAIAQYPRREDVAPLDEWLAQVVPAEAKYETTREGLAAFEWKANAHRLERLVRYWPSRPRGVTYLGNSAFQRLVTPRSVAQFNISVASSDVNWLEVSVEFEEELEALSLDEVETALAASDDELLLLPGGRLYRRGDLEGYKRRLDTLDELGIDLEAGTQRLHALQLTGASSRTLQEIADVDARFADFAQQARELAESFKGVPPAEVPEPTAAVLRPYQRLGVDFIVWGARTFGGAILADDMGLGKTLEMLAALSALRIAGGERLPSLVVCPASVAHNWQREAERFAPELKVVVVERGPGRRKILERLEEYDLIVKNYALTRRDADLLGEQKWFMVCVDEAQAIKNPKAQITRTVKALDARYRFALTGTPIENRLTDLWSITDFAVPGYLQSLSRFEERVKQGDPDRLYRMLRARLRPVLIRRMKSEAAPELPPRIEERRDCQMVASQRKAYLAEVKKARMLLEEGGDERVIGKERFVILAALTRLRQICCDPALVGLPDKGSGKVDELMALLAPLLDAGHKVLLFSQFVRMIDRLTRLLNGHEIPTWVLTGRTRKRPELIDAFEAEPTPSVFLISLKAGGQGLNLVSASHVILFDPWWNPAVEAQAIDRTHRIGQDKTVVAFRLVTAGTIEERILELQERKRDMIQNVLEEGGFNRSLSREDFNYLLAD